MISIIWTYAWTALALVSFVVRCVVLAGNIHDQRLSRHPRARITSLMRRIIIGHLRLSLALAFVSISNTVIGVVGLWLYYRPSAHLGLVVGYFFISYFLLSELTFTILAWLDLRVRNHGAAD